MKRLFTLAAAFFAVCAAVHADISYLLFQGPFGSGSTEETFKYQISYPAGSLTGQDLLNAVFGTPMMSGSYTDAYSGMHPFFISTKGANGEGYITFTSVEGPFPIYYTINGSTVTQDPAYDPGWVYYVAGGSGDNALGSNVPGPYASGTDWLFSNDGSQDRQVANGSFDGWVFGASGVNTEPAVTITGTDNAPVASNFASAPVILVPEPDSLALLSLGVAGVWAATRKRR